MRKKEINPHVNKTTCCGMYELYGLYCEPKVLIEWVADAFFAHNKKPLIVFTDNARRIAKKKRNLYAGALVEHIKKNNLGTVVETEYVQNLNSGNSMKGFLWSVKNIESKFKELDDDGKKRRKPRTDWNRLAFQA